MPTHGVSGAKPMRPQDHLGTDVKLDSKQLDNDPWAQKMLREIGKTMENDNERDGVYMGSIAIHFYKSKDMQTVAGQYGVAMKTQMCIGTLNEYIAMMGVSNLAVEMRKYFGRAHKTTDQNDKRGQG